MSDGRAFFDTNVLIYVVGSPDPAKQARAQELFRQYYLSGQAVVSTQVVQEFYTVARGLGMARRELLEAVDALLNLLLVINGPAEIKSALEIEERYQVSFWDALILAAAESGGADLLFTEDLNDGQQYGAVLVRNPFRAAKS